MATPKKGSRLGSGPAHQELMLAQQAGDLFRHGRITTTHAKARMLRPYAEKLITKGKQGDLPARRAALSKLRDRDVVAYLFEDVAPRFADRPGGYTRIMKLGPRSGDNAPMAIIELVEQAAERGEDVIEESKATRSRGLFGRGRKRAAAAVESAGGAVAGVVENVSETAAEAIEDAAEAVADVVDDSGQADSSQADSSAADSSADSSADASGSADEQA